MSSWIQKIKSFPINNRGQASALSDLICILVVSVPFLILMAMKIEFNTIWLLGGLAAAKLAGTTLFFRWASIAQKANKK